MKAEVEVLFDSDKDQRGERQRPLQPLHSHLVGSQRFPAPLRRWAIAEVAEIDQDRNIYQRADERDREHRDTNPVRMEANHYRSGTRAKDQCADSDGEADPVDGYGRSADALQ